MTPKEYIEELKCKPLTEKELRKGKEGVKIYGTKTQMPWTEIYSRIAMGNTMEELAFQFGHGRKIALWAVRENIEFVPELSNLLDNEIKQRTAIQAVADTNPAIARTMLEMANEYAPNLCQDIAVLSTHMVKKAQDIVQSDDCSASELLNVAGAIQKMTDTLGFTERFGSAVKISGSNVQVNGFEFVLDAPPEHDIIDIDEE